MAEIQTFAPGYGTGITVSPTTSSARSVIGNDNYGLCLTNLGTVPVYIRTGGSDVVATVADYPVLAGQQVTITKGLTETHIAYITSGGTGSLHVMRGQGF